MQFDENDKFVPEFDRICEMFYKKVVLMNESVSRLPRVEKFLFQEPEKDDDDDKAVGPPDKYLKVGKANPITDR